MLVGGVNKRYAHKWQQVIFYLSERGEKKVRPWCASCQRVTYHWSPWFNSKSSSHYHHPVLNQWKTNCSTDPRSARKGPLANSRILPRSPDWQLINLPWLRSLLPGDKAWARAEDSPMPGCVHPRWSTCLDQTLSTGRGQIGKNQKRGVLGISTSNKTNHFLSGCVFTEWACKCV